LILLSVEAVSKSYRRGRREHAALRGLSMTVDAGKLVVVVGPRQSGRSTLARVASGVEIPDEGKVVFEGSDLRVARGVTGRRLVLCSSSFSPLAGETVIDHVATGLLAQHRSLAEARRRAESSLARVGVTECASMRPCELNRIERVRVSIARALAVQPRMIVLDDPTKGVGLLESDPLLRLLRLIADDGIAVLVCSDDTACVAGSDRALMLDAGSLRGEVTPKLADVVPLRRDSPPRSAGGQGGAEV